MGWLGGSYAFFTAKIWQVQIKLKMDSQTFLQALMLLCWCLWVCLAISWQWSNWCECRARVSHWWWEIVGVGFSDSIYRTSLIMRCDFKLISTDEEAYTWERKKSIILKERCWNWQNISLNEPAWFWLFLKRGSLWYQIDVYVGPIIIIHSI